MKVLFSGYLLPGGLDEDKTRSLSIWKSKSRKAEVPVLVIEHRNTVEKQKLLAFIADFEAHNPYTGE